MNIDDIKAGIIFWTIISNYENSSIEQYYVKEVKAINASKKEVVVNINNKLIETTYIIAGADGKIYIDENNPSLIYLSKYDAALDLLDYLQKKVNQINHMCFDIKNI